MDGIMNKYCPDLISYETLKATLIGTGDFTRPVLRRCIESQCAAYKKGKCMKYDNPIAIKKGNCENE